MLLGAADRLQAWHPADWPVAADWQPVVQAFLASEAGQRLAAFIRARLLSGATIYPPQPFRALELTPLAQVKVVIVGQDPYHGPGQAEGLAFSVAPGIRPPPSLKNIFKELAREAAAQSFGDMRSNTLPTNGSLVRWAQQGVLLLNTCLTVEEGLPASHANQGWEVLTDEIVKTVARYGDSVVFMLWGAHAQKLASWVRQAGADEHLLLTANHPSPLSALRLPKPFMGCDHFDLANAFLKGRAKAAIPWHNLGLT